MSLCGIAAPNCTLWSAGEDFSTYQADPDIAGIGVISAFIVTSFLNIAIGVQGIVDDRNIPKSEIIGNENAWGFGQLIQVLLLSSILLTFKDSYSQQSDKRARRARKSRDPSKGATQPDDEFDATAEDSHDSEDTELAHVTLARRDTEAGGRGGGIGSTST